jgi:stearoyl-CoA desaturase (delta-9 desaturase)
MNVYRLYVWAAFFPATAYLLWERPDLLWVTLAVYCVQQLVGFNAYLHRLVSHRSYETYPPVEFVMGILSVLCLTGSPISWAWIHRAHHRYSDTEKDPHCHRVVGHWKALFCLYHLEHDGRRVAMKDVLKDPIMVFMDRWYFYIHALAVVGLYVLGGLDLVLAGYVLPAALHAFLIAYVLGIFAHQWGYRNYETKDHSKNSLVTHILTVGDGWHNNHHAYPGRYSFQHKWWELDPTAWFIWVIKRRG